MASPSNTKRTYSIRDTRRSGGLASMSMSAPVTVAPRYKPPSFSTERSVALLAFLGNLAIAHHARGVSGNYAAFKAALCALESGWCWLPAPMRSPC
jgi:hypothetical protein